MREFILCPACKHENRSGARFCSQCGKSLAGIGPTFADDPKAPRAQVEEMRWRRRPGEIAARIESRDMPKMSSGNLIVEEDTLAVILRDGKVTGEQGPGVYTIQSMASRYFGFGQRPELTAILIDSGELPLEFALTDLWTVDPLRLNATCRLVVQVANAQRFIASVLKAQPTLTVHDLRQLIFPELRDAAQAYVGDYSLEQLDAERNNRRDDFAVDVQERLRDLFDQSGLAFRRVQMFDLRHPRIDALRGKEEELFLGPAEFDLEARLADQTFKRREAELRGAQRQRDLDLQAASQDFSHRQRLADLANQEELHKVAQEDTAAAQYELRAQAWERMRRAVQQNKLNEATTQAEWDDFLAEADKNKLLREDDLKEFRDRLRWGDEDRQKERAHLVALADLHAEYERKAAALSEQHKHDQSRLQYELALQRATTLGKLEVRQAEVEAQMRVDAAERARQEATTDAARQQASKDADHARIELAKAEEARRAQERAEYDHRTTIDSAEQARQRNERTANVATDLNIEQQTADAASRIALQGAKTADEIARLQRQREKEEDDADLVLAAKALAMLKENQAAKQKMAREDEEEKRRIAREDELRRQEAAIAAEKARHEMELAKQAQAQQHELSTLKLRSEMSVEALISLSGPQQAQILGELKRTEQFKGMSEEQILILAAERSPDVAKALLAKMQAAEDGKLQAAEAAKWQALADERSKHEAAMRQQIEAQQAAQMKVIAESAARETQAAHAAAERAERMAKEAAERQERSNSEALRVVGDVAKTYAQNQAAPAAGPTVILPPGGAPVSGGPTVIGGGGAASVGVAGGAAVAEVQVCPKCRVKTPVGEKFCANCGHRFFE
ncbi:MAG: hypothetical protein IAE85_07640 [Anaerolinea sp.]|nr:hypothetical protein [Anaerolinea sp.]